jgi:site-specific DNA recombinase
MNDQNQIKRCAIYTRKSTDEGLDMKFNSLDAQWESCSSYIRSMSGLGWRLIEKHYDDGGFSGGNTQRPALTELLKDIENDMIDIVVVYKIDRFSRKLTDFVTLFKTFEQHHVSFVSVTQQIDTSSAMGRMMLNVLMSFAQFEREQSADRVRDKMYATKKKGMWVGGSRPYGYKIVDKQLKIDPMEAPAVQMAFERYAATGSSFQVANELNASSYKRPEGCVWVSRHVMKILKNPLYIGKVVYQRTGEVFDGIHDPLISQERYDYVNEMIKKRGGGPRKGREPMFSPLTGLLRCGKCGRAMVPTTSRCKPGTLKRYFYYRCSRRTKGYDVKCDTPIMPADVIERIVREKLNPVLNSEPVVNAVAGPLPDARAEYAVMIANGPAFWDAMEPSERVKLFKTLVKEVKVFADHIEIVFTFDKAVLSVPVEQKRNQGRLCLRVDGDVDGEEMVVDRTMRQAKGWVDGLVSGVYPSKKDLSRSIGVHSSTISRLTRLCFLSPTIIEGLATGKFTHLSINKMIPVTTPIWSEQHALLGIEG